MSQESIATNEVAVEMTVKKEPRQNAKASVPVQTIIESLKSTADDIGQVSELTSEEKLLVAEFFKSLLKMMQPLASSIPVDISVVQNFGDVTQAHIDPTGHLALLFDDGHLELKNLEENRNRDLMITVVEDVLPRFKNLTGAQKRKIENRIKFLTTVTKEMQKISETVSALEANP